MTDPVSDVYVAIGSNLGDRSAHLRYALRRLAEHPDICVTAGSPVFESPALTVDPAERQPDYLNAVVKLCTPLGPEALLDRLMAIERGAGRVREGGRWAPRTLDLDILAYDGQTIHSERLHVPHPRLARRLFVLRPWAAIAPEFVVPAPFDATVGSLLDQCEDPGKLSLFSESLLD